MIDEHDPGCCPRCGEPLEVHGTEPGIRRYWVCEEHRRPVVVLPPENIGWALTQARTPLSDPFDHHELEAFDEGVTFTDRFCNRLELVSGTVREHNRERHLSRADQDADGKQVGLEDFGAATGGESA